MNLPECREATYAHTNQDGDESLDVVKGDGMTCQLVDPCLGWSSGTPCCLPGTGPGSVEFPCESAPGHCCRTASERSRLETQRSGWMLHLGCQ